MEDSQLKVQCIDPDKDIYNFQGELLGKDNLKNELDLFQFIPRGSTLKNSQKVYALVIYTGIDTKLVLNQGRYQNKISSFLGRINYYLGINICFMFFLDFMMSQVGAAYWLKTNMNVSYYIFPKDILETIDYS